jgi:copper chaperone CopZ
MRVERTYVVEGMTCGHCKAAVEEEVGALPGVDEVRVDLASGRVTVVGDGVDDDAVAGAVDEAGYAVRS